MMARTVGKVKEVKKVWLGSEDAKAYLGCTDRFLRTLREKAEVSYSKYGKTIWYSLESINRFLSRNRVIK